MLNGLVTATGLHREAMQLVSFHDADVNLWIHRARLQEDHVECGNCALEGTGDPKLA